MMTMFRRRLARGAMLATVAALVPTGTALAQQGQFLVHEASGLCVDVSGAPGVNNGARLQLWQCETANNRDNGSATDQKWFWKDGFIRNALSARCFDVPGAPGVAAGSGLQLWDCESSGRSTNGAQTDQQFDHVDGQFRHRLSGQCIGPERTEYRNGVRLVLTRCTKVGAADLEFTFRAPSGAAVAAAPAPKPAPAAPAAPAAPGKKRLIYPDVAGASQTCVMPVDEKTRRVRLDAGARLMLVACSADNASAFAVANRQIVLAARPDLCVTVAAGARQANLVIERCQDSNVPAWEVTGTSTTAARVRVAGGVFENQCWSIPRLTDPANPPLPYDLVLKDCRKGDMRFFVE